MVSGGNSPPPTTRASHSSRPPPPSPHGQGVFAAGSRLSAVSNLAASPAWAVQTGEVADDALRDPLAPDTVRAGHEGLAAARRALSEAMETTPVTARPARPVSTGHKPPRRAPQPPPAADDDGGEAAAATLTSDGVLLQMVQGQLREQLERALADRDTRIGRLEAENTRLREELAVVAEAVARAMRPAT